MLFKTNIRFFHIKQNFILLKHQIHIIKLYQRAIKVKKGKKREEKAPVWY